jgi:LuxR family maltose regulon positive regulatory protein
MLFWSYFIESLLQIFPERFSTVRRLIHSSKPSVIQNILIHLINEINVIDEPLLVVLDDFHIIENSETQTTMGYFISHIPPKLQLVIISRSAPLFSLAVLRARNQILEINTSDLRFSTQEIQDFFKLQLGVNLEIDEAKNIGNRTEGWITGIQLAALSLNSGQEYSKLNTALSGINWNIANYLVDEVLLMQPEDVQSFLKRSALLKQISAPLCRDVLGFETSIEIITYIDRSNLFLVALDHQREWFRYHPFFRDLLRDRLMKQEPEIVRSIYHQAIKWFAAHNMPEEAVEVAIEAQLYEEASQIILPVLFEMLNDNSKTSLLIRWLSVFPIDFLRRKKTLWRYYVLALVGQGSLNEALDTLNTLWGKSVCFEGIIESDLKIIRGLRSMLLCPIICQRTMNFHLVKQLATEAINLLPQSERAARGFSIAYDGFVDFQLGDAHRAHKSLEKAIAFVGDGISVNEFVFSNYLAEIYCSQGLLNRAAMLYQNAREMAYQQALHESPLFSDTLIGLGCLFFEWNNLEEARNLLQNGIELAATGTAIERYLNAYSGLWLIHDHLDLNILQKYLKRANEISAMYHHPPIAQTRINTLWTALEIQAGNFDQALRWMEDFLSLNKNVTGFHQPEWLLVVQLLMINGHPGIAVPILKELRNLAREGGRFRDYIRIGVDLTVALYQTDKHDEAIFVLDESINHAQPECFCRSFLKYESVLPNMLYQKLKNSTDEKLHTYIQSLLDSFVTKSDPSLTILPASTFGPCAGERNLIDALSNREIEVAQLLAQGLTYRQIANHLLLSENTIRTHVKRIYDKLSVNNRTQAIERIRQKGYFS